MDVRRASGTRSPGAEADKSWDPSKPGDGSLAWPHLLQPQQSKQRAKSSVGKSTSGQTGAPNETLSGPWACASDGQRQAHAAGPHQGLVCSVQRAS